jgi:ketosteroid isomerase-like protein
MSSLRETGADAELRAAEQALYAAMIDKDFPALERILSPDLIYVHSTAVAESKTEYLTGVAKGLYEYERIASRDVAVSIHGKVAIMRGIVDMAVGLTIQPKASISLLFVLVWLKRAGSWQLTYRQATRRP